MIVSFKMLQNILGHTSIDYVINRYVYINIRAVEMCWKSIDQAINREVYMNIKCYKSVDYVINSISIYVIIFCLDDSICFGTVQRNSICFHVPFCYKFNCIILSYVLLLYCVYAFTHVCLWYCSTVVFMCNICVISNLAADDRHLWVRSDEVLKIWIWWRNLCW